MFHDSSCKNIYTYYIFNTTERKNLDDEQCIIRTYIARSRYPIANACNVTWLTDLASFLPSSFFLPFVNLPDEGSIIAMYLIHYSLNEWLMIDVFPSSYRNPKEGIFIHGDAIFKVSQPTKAVLCFQQNRQNKTRSIPSKTTQK